MLKKERALFLPIVCAAALTSLSTPAKAQPAVELYTASLKAVNSQGPVTNPNGLVSVNITGDTLTVEVQASGLAPNTKIIQMVHTGSRCPNINDDTNKDGFVDAVEADAIAGKTLLPLTDQLGASEPPANPSQGSPTSGANGSYSFSQSTSLKSLVDRLRKPGPTGDPAPLAPNEDLHLERRIVVLHGVPANTTLPPTVRGAGGATAQETLPIACGEFKMQTKLP